MFRSQTMLYHQLVMPRESAWDILNGLGELGAVQLIDQDPSVPMIHRPFANYIKRCDDILAQIQHVIKCVHENHLSRHLKTTTNYEAVIGYFQKIIASRNSPGHLQLNDFEAYLGDRYRSINTQSSNLAKLNEQRDQLIDFQKMLMLAKEKLGNMAQSVYFQPLVGLIKAKDSALFERTLFRITRGNSFISIHKLDEAKSLYIVVSLISSQILNEKLTRLCHSMALAQYEVPHDDQHYLSMINSSQDKIQELSQLIIFTTAELTKSLSELLLYNTEAQCSTLELIRLYVIKESELYVQLHRMRMQGSLFVGELWIPISNIATVEGMLQNLTRQSQPSGQLQPSMPREGLTPPTYFKLNAFTRVAQEIVNTYGVPRYKEFNPGILTCITFPFLFGVMFGDMFHGSCLIIVALLICWKKPMLQKRRDLKPYLDFRFMLLLMGLFSVYNGIIYNDFAGLSLNLFGSCYELQRETWHKVCTYQFGIDPVWQGQLSFVNSFKMKLSVIISYLHMGLGITMMAMNQRYNKNRLGIIAKFFPQILFLTCTFGYMDLLIVTKWNTIYQSKEQPPSIINSMISMILGFGEVEEGTELYRYQSAVQLFFVLIAIACVPWMWYPHIAAARHKIQSYKSIARVETKHEFIPVKMEMKQYEFKEEDVKQLDVDARQIDVGSFNDTDIIVTNHESDTDVLVHESIETIEFALGCVSNTASYLRLWALSLAHSQLAEVFYDLLLAGGVKEASIGSLLFLFPFWAMATGGVLLIMDSMECFLHALRLHWVEFQNKFYKGDGVKFEPFSYIDLYETHPE